MVLVASKSDRRNILPESITHLGCEGFQTLMETNFQKFLTLKLESVEPCLLVYVLRTLGFEINRLKEVVASKLTSWDFCYCLIINFPMVFQMVAGSVLLVRHQNVRHSGRVKNAKKLLLLVQKKRPRALPHAERQRPLRRNRLLRRLVTNIRQFVEWIEYWRFGRATRRCQNEPFHSADGCPIGRHCGQSRESHQFDQRAGQNLRC